MSEEIGVENLVPIKELLAPYYYQLQNKGKARRVKLLLSFNHWLRVPEEKLIPVMETLNMLYTIFILADDIEDNSKSRGGLPAAHCIFGVPLTLHTSVHTMFIVLDKASKLCVEARSVILEELIQMVRGQSVGLYWRDNDICPTEKEYFDLSIETFGRILLMSIRLLQLLSENKTDYSDLLLELGSYFQVREDYCNLQRKEKLEDWPAGMETQVSDDSVFCEDITEGKFTLPTIHAMKTKMNMAMRYLIGILRQRTKDIDLKKSCVSLLTKSGSLQYTRDRLMKFDQDLRAKIAHFGGNPELESELNELLDF